MCLIAWRWSPHAATPLLWAANRDEFAHRPSAAQQLWREGEVTVLSGLDLAVSANEGAGETLRSTWAGVNNQGKFAWLTNIRSPNDKNPTAPSRGLLVAEYLANDTSADDTLARIRPKAARYNGFNLVLGHIHADPAQSECWHYNSRNDRAQRLDTGVYGVSNADLDTPWPKTLALVHAVNMAGAGLAPALAPSPALSDRLFAALADRAVYPAAQLPATGLSVEREQQLSAAFIATQFQSPADPNPEHAMAYGTRASAVAWYHGGAFHSAQRSFDSRGDESGRVWHTLGCA